MEQYIDEINYYQDLEKTNINWVINKDILIIDLDKRFQLKVNKIKDTWHYTLLFKKQVIASMKSKIDIALVRAKDFLLDKIVEGWKI